MQVTALVPRLLVAVGLFTLVGCTAIQVEPLATAPASMCIRHNPKVQVDDFVPVLRQGFSRHGIETRLYREAIARAECPYLVTYSARRSWDFVPYLSQAEVQVLGPDRRQLASADYRLRGKGGFSLLKWQGTATKMTPVIDRLLADVRVQSLAPPVPAAQTGTPALGYEQRLQQLQAESLGYEAYMQRLRELNLEYGR